MLERIAVRLLGCALRALHPTGDLTAEARWSAMAVIVKVQEGQWTRLTFSAKDDRGRSARLDGEPKWDLADGGQRGVTLEVSDGGLSAKLTAPVGSAGTARVTVTGDADLGQGVREVSAEADFVISPREAVAVEIVPEPPVDTV